MSVLDNILDRLYMGELLSINDILSLIVGPPIAPETLERLSADHCYSCKVKPVEATIGGDCWEGCCNWSENVCRGCADAMLSEGSAKEYPFEPATMENGYGCDYVTNS